jgi:hypothetical protein
MCSVRRRAPECHEYEHVMLDGCRNNIYTSEEGLAWYLQSSEWRGRLQSHNDRSSQHLKCFGFCTSDSLAWQRVPDRNDAGEQRVAVYEDGSLYVLKFVLVLSSGGGAERWYHTMWKCDVDFVGVNFEEQGELGQKSPLFETLPTEVLE